jgi:hypothetical protein
MQHFGANNFEPCRFKASEDAANNVFCHRVWFDDGKSTFNSHDYLCDLLCGLHTALDLARIIMSNAAIAYGCM